MIEFRWKTTDEMYPNSIKADFGGAREYAVLQYREVDNETIGWTEHGDEVRSSVVSTNWQDVEISDD